MKVLNLRCSHDHRFEGWFASDDDFVSQGERNLLTCPMCNDADVTRLPSAPRLNVLSRRDEPAQAALPASASPAQLEQQKQGLWLRAVREMVESTEDVGERFPEEARRIHYGETEQRGIRGRASPKDADALRDEGIDVFSVALPEAAKGPLQ
jgi:hypothetical protein